jgi:hypothetical protein
MSNTQPLVRVLHRLAGAFWRRRFLHWLVRAVWLALLVPTTVMAGYLLFDWRVAWNIWIAVMALVALISLAWSLRPINLRKMTQRLDELLAMRAQLMTAYEVSRAPTMPTYDENPVAEQLMQDAVRAAADLRRQVNLFGRGFWLELQTLIAVGAVLGGLLIFDALSARIPAADEVELPPAGQEPQADEVIPPDPTLNPPPFQ